jgi:hypothetical protein
MPPSYNRSLLPRNSGSSRSIVPSCRLKDTLASRAGPERQQSEEAADLQEQQAKHSLTVCEFGRGYRMTQGGPAIVAGAE